jgi:hypothetical protein
MRLLIVRECQRWAWCGGIASLLQREGFLVVYSVVMVDIGSPDEHRRFLSSECS